MINPLYMEFARTESLRAFRRGIVFGLAIGLGIAALFAEGAARQALVIASFVCSSFATWFLRPSWAHGGDE